MAGKKAGTVFRKSGGLTTQAFSAKSSPFRYYKMIHELMLPPLRVKTLGKDIRTEWRIVVMSNKNNSIFSPGASCARDEAFSALRPKFRDARMTSEKLYVTFSTAR